MIIRFKMDGVKKLVSHTKSCSSFAPSLDEEPPIEPALWLVGDQGVYLMSNGIPPLMEDGSIGEEGQQGTRYCVFAEGMNPSEDSFDDWWPAKRESFGPDDGADPLKLTMIEEGISDDEFFELDITSETVSVPRKTKGK